MEYFFNPKGIAVIGATPNINKVGYSIIKNLLMGYRGLIYPVNPGYTEIEGLSCYPSVLNVPDPVDLAIIFVPAPKVPNLVRQCAKRGIKGVMIQSAGFAEVGREGEALQEEIVCVARETGIRIWGPNCMGIVDVVHKHVFSFVSPTIWEEGMLEGKVSLIVQSGLLSAGFLIDLMSHTTAGISKACSIGNKADVDECDLLEYLMKDPLTTAIGLYIESICDGPRFFSLCKASEKPVVVLKGGKSEKGAEAAMSHTASMAGNFDIIRGAFKQVGIVEASDFHEMAEIAKALAMYPHVNQNAGGRIAIITFSGAAGIVSTDLMTRRGLRLAELSAETLESLKVVYPEWMPPTNPIDLWPAIERSGSQRAYGESVKAVCRDPGVDAILMHLFVGGVVSRQLDLAYIAEMARKAHKPLFLCALGRREELRRFNTKAHEVGVPTFREIGRAIEGIAAVLSTSSSKRRGKYKNKRQQFS
ncbi:MAG: hypothetical protein DRH12_00905 [Deltaproteobacteria bacterium]|nr:MAG: hypothetical protein DRH12_00905 [Deltaproteobacteria bacterium]